MRIEFKDTPLSPTTIWTARILTYLPALFLIVDAVMKFAKPKQVVEATTQLGYAERTILQLGIVLLISTIVYLVPRTAVLGAILLTGYLGGAVATHVRVGAGWFSILFPVIFGVMLWGGIHLRDTTLQSLIPFTTETGRTPQKMLWAGYVMSILPALLLCFSAFMKFTKAPPVIEGFAKFGFPDSTLLGIGIVEVLCTILYLIPRTAVLGAILLTGYLGGATATHYRVGDPYFATIIAGILVWGGLFLRNEKIRSLIPLRKQNEFQY
jgi:DoxX-like family